LPSPLVRRIDHVVSLVHDAGAALQACTRLGFPLSWALERQDAGWTNGAVWLGDCSLEFLTPHDAGAGPGARFFTQALERGGPGTFMLALEATAYGKALAAVRAAGALASVYESPVAPGARSYRSAFLTRGATPGVQSFFCEYDPPFVPVDGGRGALNVKKLDHVIIATEDLEDALRLWERNVGLKEDTTLEHPLGAGFKAARLPVGESFLELVQPEAPEGRFYEQVQERGEGLFSVSVEVDDLDEAVRYLREKGATVSDPEASIWPGARLARINHHSTHGVSIQLIERR